MGTRRSILLLEDDPNLGFMLKEHLESNGFAVELLTNGADGLAAFRRKQYALCLVDVMMPTMDGFTFTRELRSAGYDTPVIFLTAKLLKEDRIEGFRAGADDYVTKPFSMEELLLRIGAVLKRTNVPAPKGPVTPIPLGSFMFDPSTQRLTRARNVRRLTAREAAILQVLALRKNDVVERKELLNTVWGDDSIYNSRSLDVFISKLRKYLSEDAAVEIGNVHGVGYKLVAEERPKASRGRSEGSRSRNT